MRKFSEFVKRVGKSGWVRLNLLALWLSVASAALVAQTTTTTTVSGILTDAANGEPLPYVDVYFENTTTGGSTDENGAYEITTRERVTYIVSSYVGYREQKYPIVSGQSQVINIELVADAIEAREAIVTATKQRYSKKDNPAVDLMREVIDRKDINGLSGKPYCTYEKYEKVQVDLNNIGTDFRDRKIFNGLEFVWDYLDSTDAASKPFLPMFLRETASTVYSRAEPATEREYITGSQSTKLDAAIDQSNLDQVINALYAEVDIYENDMLLLEKQFISPLAPLAISFYRFYIIDTILVEGQRATNISFIPKNQSTYGFTGSLYIATDSSYQVLGVKMGLYGEVNLNFVRSINIEQTYRKMDSSFLKVRDQVVMDFALTEKTMGFTGTKTVYHDAFDFAPPVNLSVFEGIDRVSVSADAEFHDRQFWLEKRQVPLNQNEAGIYQLVDTMANAPKFKRIQKTAKILLTGYVTVGKFDLGPYTAFFGFNNVEGFKPKFGGQTNTSFSKKIFLQGYTAYGARDQRFKYAGLATYSFNDNYLKNPRHYVTLSYVHDTDFPGYESGAVPANNIFSSFRWGIVDKMLFSTTTKAEYVKESKSFEYGVSALHAMKRPYGTLRFESGVQENARAVESVNTTEVGGFIRFAPNQQYTQRGNTRNRIYNKYPIFSLRYAAGLAGTLGGDYSFHRLEATAFKRFDLSILGSTYLEVSGGKVFGRVPYILMHVPKANQTYGYKTDEYNLLNLLEFVGDQYVDINMRHYFEGFFFNRIPLVKKAKLREVVTFKATFGSVSRQNNPMLDPSLIQFATDDQDRPITNVLSSQPYMEASVGVMNIAKVLRVDLVQRLTYLDQPNVQQLLGNKGLGIRVQLAVGF